MSSLLAGEVREALICSWGWLVCGSIEVPVVVHEVLGARAELGEAHVGALRVEVHVEAVLHRVGRHGRRLLLWRAETISRFGERVLDG